jgi:protein TonB
MELKKSKKANLENKRALFMEVGFVVALGLVLLAFEWTSNPSRAEGFDEQSGSEMVQESIPVTRQQQKKEPPPPPPPKSTEVINIVDNDVEIQDELRLEETEADQDTRVEIDAFVVEEEEEEEEHVFVVVEDMPSFRGKGLDAFARYVQENLVYPFIAQENGIEGTVYLRFIVDKDGSVRDVQVLRGVDPSLDKAAIEAVKKAPEWEPGKQRGKPVRVACTIPISFSLE